MKKRFLDILIRYFILLVAAFPNLWIFYAIFTPLTVYPVYFLLDLFFSDVSLMNNIILVGEIPIEIIDACVAGAAYYLLFILNLSIPSIKIKKRIKMMGFAFGLLLVVNILRILLLGAMFLSGSELFDFAHKLFWYVVSTIFVIGIWFLEVKIFKIKEIPFYSDIKFLYKQSNLKR